MQLQEKCKEIEKIIDGTKDNQKNRKKSEDIIKKRAERLKQSIAKLKEREMRFQRIALKQKDDNDRFIQQFENLCGKFKTDKPEEINFKFIQTTLENQSVANWFNDLAKNIFDLNKTKESLNKQLKEYEANN